MNGRFTTEAYDVEASDVEAYDVEAYDDRRRWRHYNYQPVPRVQVPTVNGVDKANMTTPDGVSASLTLPEKVLTVIEYQQATQKLESAINRLVERYNTLQSDITDYDRQVNSRFKSTLHIERRDINKLHNEVRSQWMMNVLVNFLTLHQLEQDLANHTHVASDHEPQVASDHEPGTGAVNPNSISSSTIRTLLPLLQFLPLIPGLNYQADGPSTSESISLGGNNIPWIVPLLILLIVFQGDLGNLFSNKK